MSESSDDDSKAVYLFGRDISQIPCFRSTILNGCGTGVAVALTHFMFTSKVRRSLVVGYCAFFVSSISYWFYCTYNYSKTRFELSRMQYLIEQKMLREGTAQDFDLSETREASKSEDIGDASH